MNTYDNAVPIRGIQTPDKPNQWLSPYELDTPNILKYTLKDYNEFYETHKHLL